jgi:hypothetical protein
MVNERARDKNSRDSPILRSANKVRVDRRYAYQTQQYLLVDLYSVSHLSEIAETRLRID